MLNYNGFINEKIAYVVGNRIVIDEVPQPTAFSDEISYQLYFKIRKEGIEVDKMLQSMIQDGVKEIKKQHEVVKTQEYMNHTNLLIETHYGMIKEYLVPIVNKINDPTKPFWGKILKNTILTRYLMTVYNFQKYQNKEFLDPTEMQKYLKFLVQYQNELFYPNGTLFNNVLTLLKATESKGKKNEDAAMEFLLALEADGYWLDLKKKSNFLPLTQEGPLAKTEFKEDIQGYDIFKTIKYKYGDKQYTIQVKPLIKYDLDSGTILSRGNINANKSDFYLFVRTGDVNYYALVNNQVKGDIEYEGTTLKIKEPRNLMVLSDRNKKIKK